jgi:hypothetical protein
MTYAEILDEAQKLLSNIGGLGAITAGLIVVVVFVFIRQMSRL